MKTENINDKNNKENDNINNLNINEEELKNKYITKDIIEKGYNPDDLASFVIRKTGMQISNLNLETLENMIDKFKSEQLVNSVSSLQRKKIKNFSVNDVLYTPEKFSIETNKQQENELLNLVLNKNKKINVIINEPEKVSGGFFSNEYYTYTVICEELNTKNKRTFDDFEWLKIELNYRYPFILVPPLLTKFYFEQNNQGKDKNFIINEIIRYLNTFMKSILRKKILRTSPILYEFLRLSKEDLNKYKNLLKKQKSNSNNLTLDKLITVKGKLEIELNKELDSNANNLNNKLTPLINSYKNLILNINEIVNDYKNLSNHMKNISDSFQEILNLGNDALNQELKNYYVNLKVLFNNYSFSYINHYEFFSKDFKNFFEYINCEFYEFGNLNKNFCDIKNEYIKDSTSLFNLKENLFKNKAIDKWNLTEQDKSILVTFQKDKKVAFEKMLPKENKLIHLEKQKYTVSGHYLIEQYNKMFKYQLERMKELIQKVKEFNKSIEDDTVNLIKLIQ